MKNKEIIISDEQLDKIHEIELEMLEEVDRICKKNGIAYCIIAGTLLGAIRHGGFIPWDDDADVAMLRNEYEKFRKACKLDLDKDRFVFQDDRNTKGYRWGYGKIRRKNTIFLRDGQEHMPYFQGVFIDVFPLDNVPDNYFLRCFHNFKCFCIRKALWSKVGKKTDSSVIIRMIYQLIDLIPEKEMLKVLNRFIRQSNRVKTNMVRILTYPTPNSEWGYLRSWYEKRTEYMFESRSLFGINDYDSYLSFKYGEYMTLPKECERKIHPVSKLVL